LRIKWLKSLYLAEEAINAKTLLKQAGVDTGDTAMNIYDPQNQIRLLTDIRDGMKLGILRTGIILRF
jgi:hypothetical protein